MKINLLFFTIFIFVGVILLILSLIFKSKDKNVVKQCNQKTKGKVIKYTLWNNNGVHFPIVEYIVNNAKYNQKLKYGWIINKSSSFNNVRTEVENNVKKDNLVINSNAHIYTNALEEHFPVGTELDVFYNPQNPNKSYVMRFIKNPAVKILFFTGLLFIILGFVGLIFLPNNVNEEVSTIVIPETYFKYSGSNATEAAISYMELGKDYCTSAVEKENNLIVEVTKEQQKNMINRNNNYIAELIKDFEDSNINYDIVESQSYKELIVYTDENYKPTLFVKAILGASSGYMLNNILENDNQDWSVYIKIINCNTGKIVAEGNVPEDNIVFGEEEWKSSY